MTRTGEHNSRDAVAYFSGVADDFHASYQADANRLERLRVWRDLLDRHAANVRTAYDLGCGSGILACELARRGIDTVGIDGSETMLEVGRREARAEGYDNVRFEQHRLPLSSGGDWRRADLVVSSSLLDYLDPFEESLASFRDLLELEGVLIFSVSNRDSLSRKLVRIVHRLTGRPTYFSLIRHMATAEEIQQLLPKLGLRCVETAYFGRADRINRILGRLTSARRSSNMLIAVARRI